MEWMKIPRLRVAVSVDGLAEHHDIRRKPATYECILHNIAGREVNIHWVITRPMLERAGYLEEYVSFWNARPEVNHIWVSTYTPQIGESSAEMLSDDDRETVARELAAAAQAVSETADERGTGGGDSPASGESGRLRFLEDVRQLFGGSAEPRRALHFRRNAGLLTVRLRGQHRYRSGWAEITLAGPLRDRSSGRRFHRHRPLMNRMRGEQSDPERWQPGGMASKDKPGLVQIAPDRAPLTSSCRAVTRSTAALFIASMASVAVSSGVVLTVFSAPPAANAMDSAAALTLSGICNTKVTSYSPNEYQAFSILPPSSSIAGRHRFHSVLRIFHQGLPAFGIVSDLHQVSRTCVSPWFGRCFRAEERRGHLPPAGAAMSTQADWMCRQSVTLCEGKDLCQHLGAATSRGERAACKEAKWPRLHSARDASGEWKARSGR